MHASLNIYIYTHLSTSLYVHILDIYMYYTYIHNDVLNSPAPICERPRPNAWASQSTASMRLAAVCSFVSAATSSKMTQILGGSSESLGNS